VKNISSRRHIDWCDRAGRHIIHPKDRDEVVRELEDHFDERIAELTGGGMRYTDAYDRCARQMGDADEVGRMLGQIHTPWLSLMVTAAKVFMAACLIVSFVLFIEPGRPVTMLLMKLTHPEYFASEGEVYELQEQEYHKAGNEALAVGGKVTQAEGSGDITRGDFRLWFERGYYAESAGGTVLEFELRYKEPPGKDERPLLYGSRVTTLSGEELPSDLRISGVNSLYVTVQLEDPMPVRWKLDFGRLDWMMDIEEAAK